MHFAKKIVFHHIYTISLFTTYQLQSSRKRKIEFSKEFVSQVYLFLQICENLSSQNLKKFANFCPSGTLLSPVKAKYFFKLLESLRSYNVYKWKKSKMKMYLEKHPTKTVWSNVLREKARLLLTVLKTTFLITHSSICDLLLSWVCLPSYLC